MLFEDTDIDLVLYKSFNQINMKLTEWIFPHFLVEVYEVLVYTGDRWAAGTDADVYLTLYGTRGDTGRRYLTHAEGSEEKFRRDQVTLNNTCFSQQKVKGPVFCYI